MVSETDSGRRWFRNAEYVLSAHDQRQLPPDEGWEVAFAGRSNAGKSSAINALCDQKRLARTSGTPGRTQQIVYFDLDHDHAPGRRIADLPGYGYAKVPVALREHWRGFLQAYFVHRRSLRGVVLIMDARHPLKPFDEQMLAWCVASAVPGHVLLTKADKLSRGAAASTLQQVRRDLPPGTGVQLFSAPRRDGVAELVTVLAEWYDLGPAEG